MSETSEVVDSESESEISEVFIGLICNISLVVEVRPVSRSGSRSFCTV